MTGNDDLPDDPGLPRGTGGPLFSDDPNACRLDNRFYPEGSIEMIDGRPATCRQGRWLGEGDDPPFDPRHPRFTGIEPEA